MPFNGYYAGICVIVIPYGCILGFCSQSSPSLAGTVFMRICKKRKVCWSLCM